ncbi:MAG: DUF4358 domain-containing protein [Clostridia bacterium]|nr:DUF4358 domain-containing protein [Clostridia bacterium]
MYKKAAAALLIAAMALTLFAGCKNKKGNEPSTSDVSSSSVTDTSAATTAAPSSTAATTAVPTTEATTTAAPTTEATTTAAPTTEAPATEAPTEAPTAPPATEAPTEPPTKAQLSAGEIGSSIASRSSLFGETVNQTSSSMGLGYFRISDSMVADSAYYKATSAVADELLVVKLAPGASADTVMSCFRSRQAYQEDVYSDYVPSEVPKIENAVMYTSGDYCVFCVCEDADAVESILDNLIG